LKDVTNPDPLLYTEAYLCPEDLDEEDGFLRGVGGIEYLVYKSLLSLFHHEALFVMRSTITRL
jgi:hypothetical protein